MEPRNPFMQPEVVKGYEAWYEGPGRRADIQEKALLSWMLKMFPDAGTILEMGCGTGHFTRWFQKQGLWSVGVDISGLMLREAKGRDEVAGLVQADVTSLPFPSGSFDLAALITSLEFVEDRLSTLAEAMRVARMGVLIGIINRSSPMWILGRMDGRFRKAPYTEAHFFTLRELKAMLEDLTSPEEPDIEWASTLIPIIGGVHKVPWGGFLGLAIRLRKRNRLGR